MPSERWLKDQARKAGAEAAAKIRDAATAGLATAGDALDPVNSLSDHIRGVFGLEPARHHMVWIPELEDESIERLMIICPPGHAKTTVAGIAFPSWVIGRNPGVHIIYFGNTSTQAEKQSVAVRNTVIGPAYQRYFPHIQKSPNNSWAGDQWYIDRPDLGDKDATMLAIGIDGPVLGARGDIFIFDDICDPDNMRTSYMRQKTKDTVAAVAFSRAGGQSRKVRMIAIMTRWHSDDIAAFFEAEGFKTIWMPATGYWDIVEPQLGKYINPSEIPQLPDTLLEAIEGGDALWPEEYPRDSLMYTNLRANSPHVWQLEFQGFTKRAGGNKFHTTDFPLYGPECGHKLFVLNCAPCNGLKEVAV